MGGFQMQSGRFGEDINLWPLPEKQPWLLGRLAHSGYTLRLHVLDSLHDVNKVIQFCKKYGLVNLIFFKLYKLMFGKLKLLRMSGLTILKQRNNFPFLKLIERKGIIRESGMEMCCTVSETGCFRLDELFSLNF
jgi:hypothetical protein